MAKLWVPCLGGLFSSPPWLPSDFGLVSSLTTPPPSFQPWQRCRARVGAGEQAVFDEACTLSAMLLGDDS